MRVFNIQDSFGLDNLILTDRDMPSPGHGEVLIKIKASSINYRDLLMVLGDYNPRQPLPLIPNSDGAGEVVGVGPGVTRVQTGDRVAGIFAQGWLGGEPTAERIRPTTLGSPLDGMLAEYVVLNQNGVVNIPSHLSWAEAATLPCAAVTAWTALTKYHPLTSGQTVLLQGTGGVSIFALQFAKQLGATVIITSSSDKKLARAEALGADHLINYKNTPDWEKQVRNLTGKVGVDHIVEVGGAGTFEKSLSCVKIGGFIATIGVLSGVKAPMSVIPILMSGLHVQGILVGSRDDFEAMNRAISSHQMQPVVDKVFPFAESLEAFKLLHSGGHFGKIVIVMDS